MRDKSLVQFSEIETSKLIYVSYFQSSMTYEIMLWGNAADINRILVFEKRVVRAIYNMGPARVS